ncbi:hypothetical protein [Streptomyces sp. NBC_00162]|uniref:WXG100-like domain-containing protein n=1 Tax=Streptomyces sp. NBC_00162 TaxID=2903629 RepID=UPI00214A9D6F|nr:hypothetical protein [Streptomyces sp. NBC_00162]UUU44120.1 hypothetical protein JIW86_38285 [Streptomyces sp. NBC_00162]
MSINPPKGIADFLGFVTGMEWPQADEDLMRRVSEHYADIAKDLTTLSGYVLELIPIVKGDFKGEAASSFVVSMNDLTGQTAGANQLEQTAELAQQLSEVALKVANQVEYTKIMAILQLVELLAQILFATIFSVFTFGSVWGPVSVMFAMTREGLKGLFMWLLSTILSQTFIGITGGIFRDLVIQLYQLGAGHTKEWNMESMIDSIKQGALTGLVGGPLEIVFHYGGKLLGRLLGGRSPASILSRRVDDALKGKADDKINKTLDKTPGNGASNAGKDVPGGAAGAGSKLDGPKPIDKPELPAKTPVNKVPDDAPPTPVRTETAGDAVTTPPAGRPEAPGAAAGTAPGTPGSAGSAGSAGRPDAPVTAKPGGTGAADNAATQPAGSASKSSGAAGSAGRQADVEVPPRLESLLATKQARQDFSNEVGDLLGSVNRQLETGFLRFGEGTIADAFADKMGDIFAKHLALEGADAALKAEMKAAGKDFGDMLARKWVRLGADHSDLSESLTKALGDLAHVQPLRNLADAMPNLFNRSEHKGFFQRVLFQENPLQGNPLYQLGGAIASTLQEGTHEMLSEGFYNVVFGDGTFEVSGGPFAAGVSMSLLGSGLHRMFEPVMVKYQDWVLKHQYSENPNDNKYFGLLHPINIASFVANMTGNPAPWPVPRPTSQTPDPSVTAEMKAMVKWVFSNPFTGTSFFSDSPHADVPASGSLDDVPNVATESDTGSGFDLPTITPDRPFSEEFADHPLFGADSDNGTTAPPDTVSSAPEFDMLIVDDDDSLADEDLTHPAFLQTEGGDNPFTSEDTRQRPAGEGQTATAPGGPVLREGPERTVDVVTPATAHTPLTAVVVESAYTDSGSTVADAGAGTDTSGGGDDPDGTFVTATPEGPDTPPPGDDDGDDTPPAPDAPAPAIPAGIAVGDLSAAQLKALQQLPARSGVFVVGMHTGPHGAPDATTTLKALITAHDTGELDGITQIQFTACSLAAPVNEATVKTVMSGLWKHRAVGETSSTPDTLKAIAADGPVWVVPTTGADTALVTAHHIGITPDGKPTVLTEGAAWHEYSDTGGPDHAPDHTDTRTSDIPDGAVHAHVRTPATADQHPDAVKFGTEPGDSGSVNAPDASIEDRVRIRYLEESQTYERRLADYLAGRDDVKQVAKTLAETVWRRLPRDKRGKLGSNEATMPGIVGNKEPELRRVVQTGNLRERMTLVFHAISTQVLPAALNQLASYPKEIKDERPTRQERPEYTEFRTLDGEVTRLSKAGRTNTPEYQTTYGAWSALAKTLRTDLRPEGITPELSETERLKALDRHDSLRWIPGAAKLELKMNTPLQLTSEQQGRLVMTGTSGSAFYFHQYAQLMADQWSMTVDHQALRLALLATFVGQGHHSVPEVMAGSAVYGHLAAVEELQMPARDSRTAPDWGHYRDIGPLTEAELRTHVAVDGKFPDERAAEYRASLTNPDVEMTDANPVPKRRRSDDSDDDTDMLDPKRERQGTSPAVPENSPYSQPGRREPEQVTPTDRPVTPEQWSGWKWAPGREDVPPPARIRTERFDPAADPDDPGPYSGTADRRGGGLLDGRATLINAEVQRFNVPAQDGGPGRTVRLVQVTLPVATDGSYSAAEVAALRDRMQGLLDAHVNLGFELPRTKDQLRMEVRLVPMPVPQDGPKGRDWITVSQDGGPGRDSDQLNFRLHGDDADPVSATRDDAMLLHELLHYAGLPDRYHDARSLFRHAPEQADASGLMAQLTLPEGTFPRAYLEAIENVTESGSVLYDNNGPGSWTVPNAPVRGIPAGITVGDLSTAQLQALNQLPPHSGVFVVGMHTGSNGAPDTDTTLKALITAHDTGKLDGITRIQFTACDLANPVNETTVKTVMSGLWQHRANGEPTPTPDTLTALAANAPVWYLPTGHLVTAQHIGITPDGNPTILTDNAAWHEYTDTGDPGHTPTHTATHPNTHPDNNLTPTTEPGNPHPHAVKFGTEPAEQGPLSRVLPKESWPELLESPDDRMTTLLGEVLDGRHSDWRTLNAETYLKLRARIEGDDQPAPLDADVMRGINDAFDHYDDSMPSAADDPARLKVIAETVELLQTIEDLDPSTTADLRFLAQRFLLDHGYTPSLLDADGYTADYWQEGADRSYDLAMGMAAFARLTSRLPQGSDTAGGPLSRVLPEASWSTLLANPDDRRTALLGEVLDGQHGDFRTLNTDSYLKLLARIEGDGPPAEPSDGVRAELDTIFSSYHQSVAAASGDKARLTAVAKLLKQLQKVGEFGPSPEIRMAADVRFLAQRLLLDQGYTPSLLPATADTAKFWKRMERRIAEDLAMGMATFTRLRSRPAEQSPDVDTVSGDGPGATASVTPPGTGTEADASVPPPTVGTGSEQTRADTDVAEAEDAADWRAELAALGPRTAEVTTAYLVLPNSVHQVTGQSDAFLRTGDKPWATLTTQHPPLGGQTLLEVTVPAGRAVDAGEGRLLVGKDDLTHVTVTGVFTEGGGLQPWQAATEADLVGLPLAMLTRLEQALHANPGVNVNSPMARLALRINYTEASRQAERPLGEFIAGLEPVQRQVKQLVQALWDKAGPDLRRKLGSDANTGSGSVGTDLVELERVVREGNLREQVYLLELAVHGDVLKQLVGFKKTMPQVLKQEWDRQASPDIAQRRDAMQARLDAMPPGPDRDAYEAEVKQLVRTDLRADEVVPPLSDRERRHTLENGRLAWLPGENHRTIQMVSWPQATAQESGGLLGAGTSNTTYFVLEAVHKMSQKWGLTVDYQLVRLALLADMLPVHHHSLHEIMRAAGEFGRTVLGNDVLDYADNWSRFRSLAPLTENELRTAMPGGRFPDEVALGLEPRETLSGPVDFLWQGPDPQIAGRRLSEVLPEESWPALLDGADSQDRVIPLIREVLDRQPSRSRDWRRLHADSYLELRRRIEGAEPPEEPEGASPWLRDEDDDVPEEDTVRRDLDAIFDDYYTAVARASGDRERMVAIADVVQRLQRFEGLEPSSPDTGITADVRILAQRFLLDQGHTPALLDADGHTLPFWQRPADLIADDLASGLEAFARLTPVRDIPAGITVGNLSTAQSDALNALPPRPGVFVVGMHTGPDGAPDTDTTLRALITAHDTGKLDGITRIQFTACDLANPVNETTVKTVMSGLWTHRANGQPTPDTLTALAANAPVWYVPTPHTDTTGHLVTAQHIGITPDGKPTILTDNAAWHEYTDTGDPGHTPTHTATHPNNLPDDALPRPRNPATSTPTPSNSAPTPIPSPSPSAWPANRSGPMS